MFRKDYRAIAKEIRFILDHRLSSDPIINGIQRKTMLITVRAFTAVLAMDNPRFDYQKFYDACGFMPEDYNEKKTRNN